MPSTYTSRLRLTLPATGELVNTWGTTVNTGITELVDASIAGAATISAWGGAGVAYTLSNNNGAADEARCMFIVASGTPGENKNIICPAVSKLYVVKNEVTGGFSVTLKTLAGTGITVPNGSTMLLRCDGTNVVDAITQVSSLTYSGTLTGGTGVVNIGSGQIVKDAAGNLGLGVTPSGNYTLQAQTNYSSGFKGFNLGGLAGGTSQNGYPVVGYNVRFTNTLDSYQYNASDWANAIAFKNGQFQFLSAASGTSGAAITFTQAMTLDASGNLGVGETSPDTRAHIYGANTAGRGQLYIQSSGTVSRFVMANSSDDQALNTYGDSSTSLVTWDAGSGYSFRWTVADTERARITSGGELCIGTTAAATGARLTVNGVDSTSATFIVHFANSSTTRCFAVEGAGRILTGTAAESPYNNTTASAANVFVDSAGVLFRSTSSLKYKTDVQDATHGLAEVMQLRPVTYKGKNDGDTVFGGLIAEEVHAAGLTEFVQYAEDGTPDALAYGNMVSLLTKAIQEQQALITDLRARVAALEAK